MVPTNNKTMFGDWSLEKTVLVTLWRSVVLVVSLVGNTTIMLAINKYHAIKLGKITTTFIGHLAASDLGVTLFCIGPVLTLSLVKDTSVSDLACLVECFTCTFLISSSVMLVCMLNICKLATIHFPLRSRAWTPRTAHALAGISWAWCCLSTLSYLELDGRTVYYDYRLRCCMVTTVTKTRKWLRVVKLFVGIGMPGILVILTTLRILHFAQLQARSHSRASLQFQSAMTAVSIAITYCLSYTPFFIYLTIGFFTVSYNEVFSIRSEKTGAIEQLIIVEYDKSGAPMSGFLYKDFYLVASLFTFLHTGANFFIYMASITSFRVFILRRVALFLCRRSATMRLFAVQGFLQRRTDTEQILRHYVSRYLASSERSRSTRDTAV